MGRFDKILNRALGPRSSDNNQLERPFTKSSMKANTKPHYTGKKGEQPKGAANGLGIGADWRNWNAARMEMSSSDYFELSTFVPVRSANDHALPS
jgi:hypothetical protein